MKAWKCPECQSVTFEELMGGVTQSSIIDNIEVAEDGTLMLDYGLSNTEGGDLDTIRYECTYCNYELSEDELRKLAN